MLYLLLDVLLTYDQLWMLEPNMAILNTDTSTLIKFGQCEITLNDVMNIVPVPESILEFDGRRLTPLLYQVQI